MSPLNEQSVVMIARVFRIGRVFRVVKKFKGLRLLFKTLMFSLPAIFNVFLLWFLVLFVFSVLGIEMFGQPCYCNPMRDYESCPRPSNGLWKGKPIEECKIDPLDYEYITRHANFDTFGSAFMVLFRCSTGENWNKIMWEANRFQQASIPYFLAFLNISVYLFLNLFVAAI